MGACQEGHVTHSSQYAHSCQRGAGQGQGDKLQCVGPPCLRIPKPHGFPSVQWQLQGSCKGHALTLRETQSMVSPSGVYSSFMVLPSLDVIYQPGFILAIAVLSSNTVDILQLWSFQGNRVEECKPRSSSHVTGVKVWSGLYPQMEVS